MIKILLFLKHIVTIAVIIALNFVALFGQDNISPIEFTQMIKSMSEDEVFFVSENWISNEDRYLYVLNLLDKFKINGGVYIGVGPEQNYTYISAVKPDLAFIVDVRNRNTLQHLIYKIIFELADTPADFFSLLFSKPINNSNGPNKHSNINELVNYFKNTPSSRKMYNETLEKIFNVLTIKYHFEITEYYEQLICYTFATIYRHNLNLDYDGSTLLTKGWTWPTFAELLQATDIEGKQRNPFNNILEYQYLKKMHFENRIIPITGDFSGKKTLKSIGLYMKEHNLTLSSFYTSNVERYIFHSPDSTVDEWVDNVKNIPINNTSIFIRTLIMKDYYQSNIMGIQRIKTFLERYNNGFYANYRNLIDIEHITYQNLIDVSKF